MQLSQIAEIQAGYQSRSKISNEADGSHCLIQGNDFAGSRILIRDKLLRINPKRNPEKYSVKQNDIIFLARGLEHFAYYIDKPIENAIVGSSFYIIRVRDDNVLPVYLAWWINQTPAQNYLRSQAGASSISFIFIKTLSSLMVQIPSLKHQADIVRTVGLWKQEKELLSRYQELKNKLISSICLNSTRNKGADR